MNTEIFLPVVGYENYEVSNFGIIRRANNHKIIKGSIISSGYKAFRAYTGDGGYKDILIHRAVAMAFIPNDDTVNNRVVDHIDRNRLNNCADNLRWCTYKNNSRNAASSKRGSICKNIQFKNKLFQVSFFGHNKHFISDNIEEALEYRNKTDKELHGEFAVEFTLESLGDLNHLDVRKRRKRRIGEVTDEMRKEELRAKSKEKFTCGCGREITNGSKYTHLKSNFHRNWEIEQITKRLTMDIMAESVAVEC